MEHPKQTAVMEASSFFFMDFKTEVDVEGDDCRAFPFEYLQNYFELVPGTQDRDNMSVKCKLCVGNKVLKSAWSTSSNLRKHIMRIHPTHVDEMEALQRECKKRRGSIDPEYSSMKKQKSLPFATTSMIVSQETVDTLIVDFVCDSVQPFSVVEEESFVNLVQGLAPGRSVMCRETVAMHIKERYGALKNRLLGELALAHAVAITADCWSHFSQTYLGVTAHWIDEESIERKSAMLTIERLVGWNICDVLAANIDKILREYHLQSKVVACITDSGSNFLKAFGMFGVQPETEEEEEAEEKELQFIEVAPIFDEGLNEFQYVLPPHQRCAAHTLNLVAVKDSQNAENDPAFKKLARSAFARCQALWNEQRSSVAADSMRDDFNKLLTAPCVTRWNSVYDSIKSLIAAVQKNGSDELDNLLDAVGLPRFQPIELAFLSEYIIVMKPLAAALNIIQKEKNMFLGFLQPTIKGLLKELNKKVTDSSLLYCKPLARALAEGVQHRFSAVLDDRKQTFAAGLIPALKFSWLEGKEKEEAIALFKDEIGANSVFTGIAEDDTSDEEAIFFNISRRTATSPALEEINMYLMNTSTDLKILQQYPIIKNAFLKANASLPSSAPVERLFSACKDVLTFKRAKLSDDNTKMQLFCQVNAKL